VTDETIPQNVRALITDFVDSVVHLEILLLISRNPQEAFSAEAVGKKLGIRPDWAEADLGVLASRGLLEASGEAPRVYRYAPRTEELRAAIGGLDLAYQQRRVSVINLIFAKPIDRLRDFADAFRLRKDKHDA